MRVALFGPVALNNILLADFLRRYTDVEEADSFDGGPGSALAWTPQWEYGDFDPQGIDPFSRHDPRQLVMRNGFVRQPHQRILGHQGLVSWFQDEEAYFALKAHLAEPPRYRVAAPVLELLLGRKAEAPPPLEDFAGRLGRAIPRRRANPLVIPADRAGEGFDRMVMVGLPHADAVAAVSEEYDLSVLCGPWAENGVVSPKGKPYVALEHGTLRLLPYATRRQEQLVRDGFVHADAVVITNADCYKAAQQLGIPDERLRFIAHPCDTQKFSPLPPAKDEPTPPEAGFFGGGPGEIRDYLRAHERWLADQAQRRKTATLREALLADGESDLLFLCPARHSDDPNAGKKGSAKLLRAFAQYVEAMARREVPKATLLLCGWGDSAAKSQEYCRELGITEHTAWMPMLPKVLLAQLYRAVDVVLDQFWEECGSFGTVTVEALASGKPVVTYVSEEVHRWALDRGELESLPPVCNALTEEHILQWLCDLARHPEERGVRGIAGRRWVEATHDPKKTALRHREWYARVLESQ